MAVMTPQRSKTEILSDFKQILQRHGVDTTRVDDNQWNEVFGEITPLFENYLSDGREEYLQT